MCQPSPVQGVWVIFAENIKDASILSIVFAVSTQHFDAVFLSSNFPISLNLYTFVLTVILY